MKLLTLEDYQRTKIYTYEPACVPPRIIEILMT